jgi:RNA polymerase sigma-70 factor, ECF subfamily
MADVPKNVAAAAPVLAASAVRRGNAGEEERELIRQCQNGTAGAFEELIRRHQQRVFSVVRSVLRRREDVEDVAQQVFMKAYVSIRSFDMRAAFSTWLYKISVNECWDYLRKKRVRPLVYESDLNEDQAYKLNTYISSEKGPADPSEQAELREITEYLLSHLHAEDRQMLVLKEVEGLSVQEISDIFDLNVNTVKVRLFRARGRLLESFKKRMKNSRRLSREERKG